jgi:hypothetical protein
MPGKKTKYFRIHGADFTPSASLERFGRPVDSVGKRRSFGSADNPAFGPPSENSGLSGHSSSSFGGSEILGLCGIMLAQSLQPKTH